MYQGLCNENFVRNRGVYCTFASSSPLLGKKIRRKTARKMANNSGKTDVLQTVVSNVENAKKDGVKNSHQRGTVFS